jgi:hypothetical protein
MNFPQPAKQNKIWRTFFDYTTLRIYSIMYKVLHTDGISPYILIYAYRSIGRWINIETPEYTQQRSIANNSKPSMVYLINNLY